MENNFCPVPDALKTALKVRKSPLEFKKDKSTLDYAQMLGDPIQKFADVLEKELERSEVDKGVFKIASSPTELYD